MRDILGIMVEVNQRKLAACDVLEIVVPAYSNPISYKGEYFYRSGSTNQTLKGAALDRFLLRKQGRHWDGVSDPSFKISDGRVGAFRLFSQKAVQSGRMDRSVLRDKRETILGNLDLIKGNQLKRAASLLFSDTPERYVSGAWIKVGYFVTNDDLLYQDEIRGSLIEQVDKTLDLLSVKYLKAYISYRGLQRLETFLFPLEALREALLNAVVHKDYGSGIPIQISVYEDRIVLWNPGRLPENWTLARLLGKHPSNPYNPLLANAFFRAGYIESWGRGVEKIERACREHDIEPPEYDDSLSGLMVTFRANTEHLKLYDVGARVELSGKKLGEKLGEKLGKTRAAIVEAMRDNPKVSAKVLAQSLGLSITAVEKNIQALKTQGLVQRIGPAKGGHWEVVT